MWLIFSGDCISSNLDLSLIIYLQGKHWATVLMLGINVLFSSLSFLENCCCHKEVRRNRGLLFANVCCKTYQSHRNIIWPTGYSSVGHNWLLEMCKKNPNPEPSEPRNINFLSQQKNTLSAEKDLKKSGDQTWGKRKTVSLGKKKWNPLNFVCCK